MPTGDALGRRVRVLRRLGQAFHWLTAAVALGLLALVVAVVIVLVEGSWATINLFGISFLWGQVWDVAHGVFGALPAIVGTLLTSALALLIAVPVALGVAIFLSEVAPAWFREPLTYVVDLSAAVPSVVYGFWAYIVLVPLMKSTIEPGLATWTGGSLLFSGHALGLDVFSASIILAIMVLPTISSLSREALQAVPRIQREAALSLGATRWEATRIAVLGPARSGIVAAVMLGLGRAVGETMAVTMTIGNIYILPTSLFSQGQTISSQIASDLSAAAPLEKTALVELGLVLLAITLAINSIARLLIWRFTGRSISDDAAPRRPGVPRSTSRHHHRYLTDYPGPPQPSVLAAARTHPDPSAWRARTIRFAPRRIASRRRVHLAMVIVTLSCVVLAVVPLVSVLHTAIARGGSAVVTPSFYTQESPPTCVPRSPSPCPLGGIGPAIEGTLLLLALASALSIPAGLFAGIYVSEYGRNRFGRVVSFLTEVMTGLPSILIGLFVYVIFIRFDPTDQTSVISGGVALSVLMVPIVTRATEESLKLVPNAVREAGLALGFPQHRVTLRVVLGCARSALITGILLGVARAGGETAALLFTAGTSQFWFSGLHLPVAAIAPLIYNNFSLGSPNLVEDAWGAALILLLIMLAISLSARLALRSKIASNEGG